MVGVPRTEAPTISAGAASITLAANTKALFIGSAPIYRKKGKMCYKDQGHAKTM